MLLIAQISIAVETLLFLACTENIDAAIYRIRFSIHDLDISGLIRLIGSGSIKIFHLFRSSEFHHLDIEPLKVVNQKLFAIRMDKLHDRIEVTLFSAKFLPCMRVIAARIENMVVDRLFILFEFLLCKRKSHSCVVAAHRNDLYIVGCDIGHFLVCIYIVGFINDRQQQFRNIILIHFPQLFVRDVRQVWVFLVVFPN